MGISTTKRWAGAALAAAWLVGAIGCQSAPKAEAQDINAAYAAGRYQEAYDGAVRVAGSSSGTQRADAELIAGLSAYQLGRDRAAIGHLTRATTSTTRGTSGSAMATRGLARARLGEYTLAAQDFSDAARMLDGNERANAYYHLALTEQKLGRWAEARTHLTIAAGSATDPDLAATAKQKLDATGFTIQFGAYEKRENADERAKAIYNTCVSAGLGPPRIVTSKSAQGATLYLVQAGRFSTYNSALNSRTKLGRTQAIITQMEG